MSQITTFPMLKCCAVHSFERNYTPGTPPYPALASPHSLKCSYSLSKVTVIISGPQWKPWAKMFINSLGHPVVNSRPSREQKHDETWGCVKRYHSCQDEHPAIPRFRSKKSHVAAHEYKPWFCPNMLNVEYQKQ